MLVDAGVGPAPDCVSLADLAERLQGVDEPATTAVRRWAESLEQEAGRRVWQVADGCVHELAGEEATSRLREYALAQGHRPEAVTYAAQRYASAALHPNLVPMEMTVSAGRVSECWPHQGGMTLAALIAHLPMTLPEKLELASQLALGLETCHRHGLVHGAITAQSVNLEGDMARLMEPWFGFCPFSPPAGLPARPELPSADSLGLGKLLRDELGVSGSEAVGLAELLAGLLMEAPEQRWPLSRAREALETCRQMPEPADWLPSVESDEVPLAPGLQIGDYRLLRHLGGGSFADVYAAVHDLQERTYALKIYQPDTEVDDLIHEYRLLTELRHPHIVRVEWCGHLGPAQPYLALEYLEGESLANAAWGDQRLSLEEVVTMLRQILSALTYLHESAAKQGALAGKVLYHRDIKPSNIMRVPGRGFVLIDFNVTRDPGTDEAFAGTGRYAPPDLLDGEGWDASGDTFALGVTCFELLCGHPPYPQQVRVGDRPLSPRDHDLNPLPEPLAAFLCRAVATRRRDRFCSAREMAATLDGLVRELAELAVDDRHDQHALIEQLVALAREEEPLVSRTLPDLEAGRLRWACPTCRADDCHLTVNLQAVGHPQIRRRLLSLLDLAGCRDADLGAAAVRHRLLAQLLTGGLDCVAGAALPLAGRPYYWRQAGRLLPDDPADWVAWPRRHQVDLLSRSPRVLEAFADAPRELARWFWFESGWHPAEAPVPLAALQLLRQLEGKDRAARSLVWHAISAWHELSPQEPVWWRDESGCWWFRCAELDLQIVLPVLELVIAWQRGFQPRQAHWEPGARSSSQPVQEALR